MMEIFKITKWEDINWKEIREKTLNKQVEIFSAADIGNQELVKELQWQMINNPDIKLLSTRRVTQDNRGRKTAGVEKISKIPSKDRLNFALSQEILGKCSPIRRIYIKKANGELRPLGIPTIEDRVKQCMVKYAIEPEWEAKFEPQSFGFRPGRSPRDASKAIFTNLSAMPKFVLDADIRKCFDTISHNALMAKMDNPLVIQNQIIAWLRAGFHDNFYNTVIETNEKATPQGSIISPLLCNIALNGIRNAGLEAVNKFKGNVLLSKHEIRQSYSLIRYADDFIAIHPRLDVLEAIQDNIVQFLKPLNLELHPDKTRIVHSMNKMNGLEPGFTFLSCHYSHYETRKHGQGIAGKNPKGAKVSKKSNTRHYNWTFRPNPDSKAIDRHLDELRTTIRKCRAWPQSKLIQFLNPQIRGWSNYYSYIPNSKAFSKCDHRVFTYLFWWALQRHPAKGKEWISKRYFHENFISDKSKENGFKIRKWTFATKLHDRLTNILSLHRDTISTIQSKSMEIDYSPYNPKYVDRNSRIILSDYKQKLFKRQNGLCNVCNGQILFDDIVEVHHLITDLENPERNRMSQTWLIHGHCHDKIHARSGSQSVVEEEPYDA